MGVMNLVRWLEALRADKPDMLGILEEALGGFRNTCRRVIASDIVGDLFIKWPGGGGYVLHGFGFDFTGGLNDVQFTKGVFLDKDGLPVEVAATGVGTGVDFTAAGYGVGSSPALWATWYHVQGTNANRVFWDAATQAEVLLAHDTREVVQTEYTLTDGPGIPPVLPGDWTLIHAFDAIPAILGNVTSVPNAIQETWQRALGISDVTAYPNGVWGYRLFDAVERVREALAVVKRGSDTANWFAALAGRDMETLDTDLTAAEANITTLLADVADCQMWDVRAGGRYNLALGVEDQLYNITLPCGAPGGGVRTWNLTTPIQPAEFRGPAHVTVTHRPTVDPTTFHLFKVDDIDTGVPLTSVTIRCFTWNAGGPQWDMAAPEPQYTWQLII